MILRFEKGSKSHRKRVPVRYSLASVPSSKGGQFHFDTFWEYLRTPLKLHQIQIKLQLSRAGKRRVLGMALEFTLKSLNWANTFFRLRDRVGKCWIALVVLGNHSNMLYNVILFEAPKVTLVVACCCQQTQAQALKECFSFWAVGQLTTILLEDNLAILALMCERVGEWAYFVRNLEASSLIFLQ